MNAKKLTTLLIAMIAVLVLSTSAFAANGLNVSFVKINGEIYEDGESLRVELGENLDIKLKLLATDNVSDVEVSAKLVGYEHADAEKLRTYDMEIVDEMDNEDVEYVTLALDTPSRLDKDNYYVRIYVEGQDVDFVYKSNIRLNVVGQDDRIDIKRVSFDPPEVVAGRALRTRVRLENLGEEDEDDVFVTVAIPELGAGMIVTSDIGELEEDEQTTTEDLLLRIPQCTKAGTYNVEVTVEYDEGFETTTSVETITVLSGDSCETTKAVTDKTVITPPTSQDVAAGAGGASFPIVISNQGSEDKTYLVSVSGVSGWGSAEVANPAPLVPAGQTEVVYAYVSANAEAQGRQVFVISVTDGSSSKEIPVTANIVGAETTDAWNNIKNILYVGVIVLLVLIVILGLVIGFNKIKANDKEEDEYY